MKSIFSNSWIQSVLLFLLGAMMPLAFAPFELWYFAPILLAVWLLMIRSHSPKKAFWQSFCFGFGMFSFGIGWVEISLREFADAPFVLAYGMVGLLAAYLALYYAFLGYLVRKIKANIVISYGVLFPLIGCLLEVLREVLLTGFPWLALGYTLTDTDFAHLIFPISGALMGSFWVYWLGGVCALIIIMLKTPFKVCSLFPALSLAGILGISYLIAHFSLQTPITKTEEPIEISLIQGNINQNDKFDQQKFIDALGTYISLSSKVAETSDIIVWPETAVIGLYQEMGDLVKNLRTWGDELDVEFILGIPRQNTNNQYFNSVLHVNNAGGKDHFYDKYRLVPFGEFIPFESIIGKLYEWINIPLSSFSKGEAHQLPFTFSKIDAKAMASICFEAVFGETLRYQATESNFLINISNDAWFGDSIAPKQHLQIVRARSIEMARPIARATNTGMTAFIDHEGRVSALAPSFTEAILTHTIQPTQGLTPYVQLGDYPWVALMTLILLTIILRLRLKRISH